MHSAPESQSIAALIVTLAAERVEDVDPKFVLMKLEEEKIRDEWQLEFLDANQWQMLGAPMGLVVAIRRCLVERKEAQLNPSEECRMGSNASPSLCSTSKSSLVPPEEPETDNETDTLPRGEPVRQIHLTKSAVPPVMPRRRQSAGHGDGAEPQELAPPLLSAASAPPSKPIRVPSMSMSSILGEDEYVIHEEGEEHR
jgi:hypothetical protein